MSKGPFRPIYRSILHHPRFVGLSVEARSLWFVLKLRLGPSGLDRVYDDELCETANLDAFDLADAREELVKAEWVRVEGNLWWLIDGYENEPMVQGPKSRTSIERHISGFRGPVVEAFRQRYGFDTLSDTLPDTLSDRSVRGERDREDGNKTVEVIGGNVGTNDPAARPPEFEALLDWLRNLEVCTRAAQKWNRNTPTWPGMILDRYGPTGIEPKAPALVVSALSDLVRKTSGVLHTRSLEAFIEQEENRHG